MKDPKAIARYCLLVAIGLAIIFAVCRGQLWLFLLTLALTALVVLGAFVGSVFDVAVLGVLGLLLGLLSRLFGRGRDRGQSAENGDEKHRT